MNRTFELVDLGTDIGSGYQCWLLKDRYRISKHFEELPIFEHSDDDSGVWLYDNDYLNDKTKKGHQWIPYDFSQSICID